MLRLTSQSRTRRGLRILRCLWASSMTVPPYLMLRRMVRRRSSARPRRAGAVAPTLLPREPARKQLDGAADVLEMVGARS